MNKYKVILIRFFTVFFIGGVGSATLLFTTGVQLTNSDDLKKFGTALLVAFVGGGIAALEKAFVNTDTQVVTPLGTQTINAPVDNPTVPPTNSGV